MIQSDSPVLREEFNHVRDNFSFSTLGKLIEVVLVESDERPQTLEHHFLVAHVGHGVDEADRVESELNEVSFTSQSIEVVTHQVLTVREVRGSSFVNQGVGSFNIVVDDVVGQHTSLALRQEEQR